MDKNTCGNERADEAAKTATLDVSLETGDTPALSIKIVKNNLKAGFLKFWQERWLNRTECRQTKQWCPIVQKQLSHQVLYTDRKQFSRYVQLITGHNFLKRHSALVDKSDDAECILCWEREETSFHLIAECSAIAWARLKVFGTPFQTSPLIWSSGKQTLALCWTRMRDRTNDVSRSEGIMVPLLRTGGGGM